MLLFKRILNFNVAAAAPNERRVIERYAVGNPFPFKVAINLRNHDGDGRVVLEDKVGQDWAGRLTNISMSGASIHVHSSAVAIRGETCRFKLSLDSYLLEIPANVAHFRVYSQFSSCGFSFHFPDTETQNAFAQVMEPISIGASLTPVETKKVKQDTANLRKEQYRGSPNSVLSVWRPAAGKSVHSFDFRMNDYGVRWSEGMTEVEPYGISTGVAPGKKTVSPFVHLTETQLEEVRWLFCLAVPNLPKSVPFDVRKFLATLIA